MARSCTLFLAKDPPRRIGPTGARISPLAALAVLVLGGCAGPAPAPPTASRAAADPPAYAPAQEVHVVSDALNRKLDRMLASMPLHDVP